MQLPATAFTMVSSQFIQYVYNPKTNTVLDVC